MHFTSFVLPAVDPPAPLLVLAPESAQEVGGLPLVTSLHRIGNEVMAYVHASPLGFPVPISDRWVRAVEEYGDEAKIVLVLEPLPAGSSTEDVPIAEGVSGDGLPSWVPALLAQRYKAATRDVPVSSGTGVMDIMIDPRTPHETVAGWAHRMMGPA